MLVQEADVWQAVLGEIEVSVSRGTYLTWFKPTRLLKFKDDVLTIGVANVFVKQQLEHKYNKILTDTLAKNGITPAKIEFKIHSGITIKKPQEEELVIAHPVKKLKQLLRVINKKNPK